MMNAQAVGARMDVCRANSRALPSAPSRRLLFRLASLSPPRVWFYCNNSSAPPQELNNGRLAMIAITGMVGQELATGAKLFE